jgi:hypothetical protein
MNPNTRAKIIKFLEENIVINFHDIRFGNGILIMAPKA